MTITWRVNKNDINVLRGLYVRQREMAADPVMQERRRLWYKHAALNGERPMILAETVGVLDELIPLHSLHCQEPWARDLERGLRELIFRYESVQDDFVIQPYIDYRWFVDDGDFGVSVELVHGENEGKRGSYHWDPPVKNLDVDIEKLSFRQPRVDREKTISWAAFLDDQFGDILPIRLRGSYWWTTGLTWTAINLIGLESLMMAMYDNPAGLHRLMSFLRDECLNFISWFEREELLTLNNEADYVGSGSQGWTDELPRDEKMEGHPVLLSDLWGLSESQETVGISPTMFEEFIFPYQLPVIKKFGLSYYGCCEPVHNRWHIIKRIPNLRRVSVSPWCDEEEMAEGLGENYIYCRKPNPTLISTGHFDDEAIEKDIGTTLRYTEHCTLEFAMKDVHTLNNDPNRLGRWVQLTREVCEA
ncbi:MAG: hypothetical protein P1S60_11655 [Anaerolineae bacterium]|nr:hypothetical protein [Anaerolineae bacterium]